MAGCGRGALELRSSRVLLWGLSLHALLNEVFPVLGWNSSLPLNCPISFPHAVASVFCTDGSRLCLMGICDCVLSQAESPLILEGCPLFILVPPWSLTTVPVTRPPPQYGPH